MPAITRNELDTFAVSKRKSCLLDRWWVLLGSGGVDEQTPLLQEKRRLTRLHPYPAPTSDELLSCVCELFLRPTGVTTFY